jgi:hypothetical protein
LCSFQPFFRDSFIICVAAVYRHHCAPSFACLWSQRLNVLKRRDRNFHAAMLHCTACAGLLAHRARLAVAHLDPRHVSPRALRKGLRGLRRVACSFRCADYFDNHWCCYSHYRLTFTFAGSPYIWSISSVLLVRSTVSLYYSVALPAPVSLMQSWPFRKFCCTNPPT